MTTNTTRTLRLETMSPTAGGHRSGYRAVAGDVWRAAYLIDAFLPCADGANRWLLLSVAGGGRAACPADPLYWLANSDGELDEINPAAMTYWEWDAAARVMRPA
jgi:hypothetical protein